MRKTPLSKMFTGGHRLMDMEILNMYFLVQCREESNAICTIIQINIKKPP